jgi:hypothetical protein
MHEGAFPLTPTLHPVVSEVAGRLSAADHLEPAGDQLGQPHPDLV